MPHLRRQLPPTSHSHRYGSNRKIDPIEPSYPSLLLWRHAVLMSTTKRLKPPQVPCRRPIHATPSFFWKSLLNQPL